MKQGRALPEVLTELQRQNAAKQDYIGAAEAFRLDDGGSTFRIGDNHNFGTTQLFHRQVSSALGIPAKYYDMMQKQKPNLLADNVNAWFSDKGSSYMVILILENQIDKIHFLPVMLIIVSGERF